MGTKEETTLETDPFLDRKYLNKRIEISARWQTTYAPRTMQDGSHLRTNLNFQV
jgi:hypothetical protein